MGERTPGFREAIEVRGVNLMVVKCMNRPKRQIIGNDEKKVGTFASLLVAACERDLW
jgi:hypothetical protein